MPLVRNLRTEDIINQVLIARDGLGEWNKKREECLFTNIVMMGMGEPLFNYENVAKAQNKSNLYASFASFFPHIVNE